jgi:epsin
MSLQTFGKGALRVAKNYTKGYSDVQAKVREATSNDPWGPSGTQMNEIAQMTHNQCVPLLLQLGSFHANRIYSETISSKSWRCWISVSTTRAKIGVTSSKYVFTGLDAQQLPKSPAYCQCLTVLDYLLHAGSENVVVYFRDNIYIVKTLKEFQFIDEYGKDQGANVRQKAKDITNLLTDETRLRQERLSRANMRDRMLGQAGYDDDNDEAPAPRGDENNARRSRGAVGDDELRRAIEESKRTLAAEQARGAEDADLARAIKLSEEEEARRKAALTDSGSLFDVP